MMNKKKYEASTAENHVDIVNLASLEGRVKDHMSNEKGAFGYIRGGAEDEWTLNENTEAFNDKEIMPRVRHRPCRFEH